MSLEIDQHIIDAFAGIPWDPPGDELHDPSFTVARVLGKLDEKDVWVKLPTPTLIAIGQRIHELSEIAKQSALTSASFEAETVAMAEGWSPPPAPEPTTLNDERAAQVAAARKRAKKEGGSPL